MKVLMFTIISTLFAIGCQTTCAPKTSSSGAELLPIEDRALQSHDQTEREQISSTVTDLLTFEGRELRGLDQPERESLAVVADRASGRLLYPAYVCQMRTASQSEPYVVCIELPYMDGYPGLCRMSATVMDSSGLYVTSWENREFYMGSRTYVLSLKVLKPEEHGMEGIGDILVAEVQHGGPSIASAQRGRDFYALSSMNGSEPPEMRLLRREDENGNAFGLGFMHYHFRDSERIMNAVVPVYESGASFWDEVATKWPLVDKLNALLFLNSTHDYEFNREYQKEIEEVRRYVVGSKYFEALERDNSSWVREYAKMLFDQQQELRTQAPKSELD